FASHFLDSPPHAEEIDLQFSLEDLETIGKGSDGVVQLVRQKWIGTLFASKGALKRSLKRLLSVSLNIEQLPFICLWLYANV
ncbi:hypothetical protein Tco_1385639, partial [Tanacetum coccineum]